MKRKTSLIGLLLVFTIEINAQWAGTTNIYNTNSGNVGVGTSSPINKLQVIGDISANTSSATTNNGVSINGGNTNIAGSANVNRLRFGGNDANSNYFTIQGVSNVDYLTVNNGNIGIGTIDTKGYKLAVNGSAVFTKVVVKPYAAWPDYVFESSYSLMPLDSLENFLAINRHLPGVPKAEEVIKNGIDLAENQKILLQKIEELTLYIIQENKTIEAQNLKIILLEQQIKILQQLIEKLSNK